MSEETAVVTLDADQTDLVVQAKRKSLARLTAASGFVAGTGTVGIMALSALLFNSFYLPGWAIVPFFLGACTLSGWVFGKLGGRLLGSGK